MNIPRYALVKAKKGVWEIIRISTGPWVTYEDLERVIAEKDGEIAELRSKLTKEE